MADIQKVLRTPINARKQAWNKMMNNAQLPESVSNKLQLSRFLDGQQLVDCPVKNLLTPTEGKAAYLTCAVCQKDYKWAQCARAFSHLISDGHQSKCRDKLEAAEKALSQAVMQDSCASAASKLNTKHKLIYHSILKYKYCVINSRR